MFTYPCLKTGPFCEGLEYKFNRDFVENLQGKHGNKKKIKYKSY